jgi:hypothetical protein
MPFCQGIDFTLSAKLQILYNGPTSVSDELAGSIIYSSSNHSEHLKYRLQVLFTCTLFVAIDDISASVSYALWEGIFFHVDDSEPTELIFLSSHMGHHTNPYYWLHASHLFVTFSSVQE